MAPPVGALRADITASTAKFEAGMKKAKRIAKQNSSAMKRSFAKLKGGVGKLTKSLGGLKMGIIALAGPAVIGLLIKKSLAAADKIAKMSDAAGISTDMMQELSHAANIAGIETSALQGAMTKFTKGIGEAKVNTGTMVTILRKLDEELLNNIIASKGAEEAFDLIMQKAAGMADQTQRAALMAAAFGRTAGTQMALLIKDGVKSLDDLRQEAHDLGIVIDEDLLRGAEAANDAMTRLGSSIKSRVTAAVLTLAPAIENLAKSLLDGLPALFGWIENLAIMAGIIEKSLKIQLSEAQSRLEKLEGIMAAPGWKKFIHLMWENITTTDILVKTWHDWETEAMILKADVDFLTKALEDQAEATREAASVTISSGLDIDKSMKKTINVARELQSAFGVAFDPDLTEGERIQKFILQLLNMMEGVILASEAVSVAISSSFLGAIGLPAIIASLIGLEAAKAKVRTATFAKGGIIDRPTLMPMRGGTALAGEAGPEAILPLTRLPGGDLGVRAIGGGETKIVLEAHFYSALTDKRVVQEIVIPVLEEGARRLENKLALRDKG